MRNLFVTGFLLLCIVALQGQTLAGSDVRVENVLIQLSDDNALQIQMDLVLPEDMKLESNRMISFTPLLRGEDQQETLPSFYVYGRKRQLVSERNNLLPTDASRIFRRTNKKKQVLNYNISLPSQPWMDAAELVLEQDICGCGNHSEDISSRLLARVDLPKPIVFPDILYRAPAAEVIKRRVFKGQAYIDFPINKIVIYPDYHRNVIELAKIDSTLRGFQDIDIQSITLHGYASPEGSYKNNTYLAKGRTQALKDYIVNKFNISQSTIQTDFTPENWEGLIRLAENSQLKEKEQVLAIARKDIDPDMKEAELRRLPEAFRHMTSNWFPVLRCTNYEIEYNLPDYSPEEARHMVKDRPSQLSLREMFDAAQLCEKGSEEFYQLIDAAVKIYPDSPEANLNAASAALERGNLSAAEEYMKKADLSTPEARNNMEYINLLKEKQ